MTHFLDIGANEGQTFDYLHEHPEYDGCTVWCFEPSPRNLPGLMDRAASERGYTVHVCPFGVQGNSSISPFYPMKSGPTADSFYGELGPSLIGGFSLDVYSVSLGNWLVENVSFPQDHAVVKLDCEGSEYDILWKLLQHKSALDRVAKILVEFHPLTAPIATEDELYTRYAARGTPLHSWIR